MSKPVIQPAPAPKLRWRFFWWFMIYFIGAFIAYFIVWPSPDDGTVPTVADRLRSFLFWLCVFPSGIGFLLSAKIPGSPAYNQLLFYAVVVFSYGFYGLHFGATCFCRLRSRFLYLMIGLLVIVSLSVTGCVCFG